MLAERGVLCWSQTALVRNMPLAAHAAAKAGTGPVQQLCQLCCLAVYDQTPTAAFTTTGIGHWY